MHFIGDRMSWQNLRTQVDALMSGIGYTKAQETFNIESVPESIADDSYCIVMNTMEKTDEIGYNYSSMFPTVTFQINVIHRLGLNTQDRYDDAIANIEEIVQTIAAPANRGADIRVVDFAGTKVSTFDDSGFWLIVESTFTAQYELSYNALITENGLNLITE